MQNNYKLFSDQLELVGKEYPYLKIVSCGNKRILRGTIDLEDEHNIAFKTYCIEIHCSEKFPFNFPKVYEIGGEIPKSADWHVNSDNSLCITEPLSELLYCKNGISINAFIKNHLIPHLVHQYYREKYGEYLQEYKHGIDGFIEGIAETMKSDNPLVWLEYLTYSVKNITPQYKRNDLCHCGSNKKFKHCHHKVLECINTIKIRDFDKLNNILQIIKIYIYGRKKN